KAGKFEEKQLYEWIENAKRYINEYPASGIKITKKLWPKEYIAYNINNLWKYNMPNGWRLIYTIERNEEYILGIILEWFSHKEYERRFGYG
ncbi:MAG: hypothetical protein AABX86_03200, partial [Nanoarchaeota archaeon]